MHDLTEDPSSPSQYECLGCGKLITSKTHPTECPGCGEPVQNRAMSLE